MSIYIDLSQFLAVPMKTGIQRISGEICRYTPQNTLTPVRLDGDRYVVLQPALIDAIGGYFRNASESGVSEIFRLATAENRPTVEISARDTVLIPEIFGEEQAAFLGRMPEEKLRRCRFIICDLLPFTHPEYFPSYTPIGLSAYFRIVRLASSCGFISEYTRDVYFQRLKRSDCHDGQVLSLGSDALGPRAVRAALNRRCDFSVLGTIEPRKNPALILEAFEPLLRQVPGLSLSFIGKMGWVDSDLAHRVQALAADKNSGFRFYPTPSDDAIRSHIEQSRATIYVSAAEGYGLPPVESLWLGTPVIASSTVPSLTGFGKAGIHFVDPLTVINLRRAVLDFLDDEYANRKAEEAVSLNLPTWRSFTQQVLDWCAEG